MKKFIKLLVVILILAGGYFLLTSNLTAVKEQNIDNTESQVLTLDKNSVLVSSIIDNLNIITNYESKILYSPHYIGMYFNSNDNLLSKDKMLYVALNKLYMADEYEENEYITFDKEKVDNVVEETYGFNKNLKNVQLSTSECGITDFVFTGETYQIKYLECSNEEKMYNEFEVQSAYKENNYIYITLKSNLVKNGTEYDYENNVIDTKNAPLYKLSFELDGDEYYLVTVKKA